MRKQAFFSQIEPGSASGTVLIPVEVTAYTDLLAALKRCGSTEDPAVAISTALRQHCDWILGNRRATERGIANNGKINLGTPGSGGYTWRYKNASVFMPDGTEIYVDYKGQRYVSSVLDGCILFQNKRTSPGRMAISIAGGGMGNAWRKLWIKRPCDNKFILANDLRKDPANQLNAGKGKRTTVSIFYSQAIDAIAQLRKVGFPEKLFLSLHHLNVCGRNYINMQNFDNYAHNYDKCRWDSNNGLVIRRLCFLVENYSGQKSNPQWQKLIDKAILAIPFSDGGNGLRN